MPMRTRRCGGGRLWVGRGHLRRRGAERIAGAQFRVPTPFAQECTVSAATAIRRIAHASRSRRSGRGRNPPSRICLLPWRSVGMLALWHAVSSQLNISLFWTNLARERSAGYRRGAEGFTWDSVRLSTPGSRPPISAVNGRSPNSPPSPSAAASRCSASSRKPHREPGTTGSCVTGFWSLHSASRSRRHRPRGDAPAGAHPDRAPVGDSSAVRIEGAASRTGATGGCRRCGTGSSVRGGPTSSPMKWRASSRGFSRRSMEGRWGYLPPRGITQRRVTAFERMANGPERPGASFAVVAGALGPAAP